MKPLQNYIEEEFEMHLDDYISSFQFTEEVEKILRKKITKSLHRIAKITAEEIVPNDEGTIKIENDLYNKKDVYGYGQALSDLQTKIKEFIK